MPNVSSVPLRGVSLPVSAIGLKFCDTMDIDQEAHRLYAGDNWSGGVDVFDISTPEAKYVKTIKTRGNFFGLAVAKELHKVFVGLGSGMIGVIDIDPASPSADTVVARIDTGGRGMADLIEYVPGHRKLYAGLHFDGFVAVVDAVTHAVVQKIGGFGGDIEQPRFNPADGMVYVAVRATNTLGQIDPKTDTLVQSFDVGVPCGPNGLAIDPVTNQALVVCDTKDRPRTVIWDLGRQKVSAVIEESGGGDGAIYDPTVDRFFAAHSNFSTGPVIGIFGGAPARLLTNVPTERGASWVAYDRTHRLVYAPAIRDGKPALISFPLPAVEP